MVNELSREMQRVLEAHPINQQRTAEGKGPANVVLLRGCGSRISVASFEQLHGMKACLVAPTKIIAGVCVSMCGWFWVLASACGGQGRLLGAFFLCT